MSHNKKLKLENQAEVISTQKTILSPWVTLIETTLKPTPEMEPQTYHSFSQPDYITLMARLPDGRFPLVRQFRPGIGRYTIEFPGGLAEKSESPLFTAIRELEEEVGYTCLEKDVLDLGILDPDVGRLSNRWHAFYSSHIQSIEGWKSEPGVEKLYWTKEEILDDITKGGEFSHALHVALIGLALIRGLF